MNKSASASTTPTRQECIDDLLRIQTEQPGVIISRNFYRVHGKFSEGVWQGYFARFVDFLTAAGIDPAQTKKDTVVSGLDGDLIFKDSYIYNENTDTYITFLDRSGARIVLSGTQHRAMVQRYSNWDGVPSTINEICRDFGMRRDWFQEYKSIHGWTHDKEPFSDEELLERPEEDMVKDVLQGKRLSLFRKTEKAKYTETKTHAENWMHFEQNVLIPLQTMIQANLPQYRVPLFNIKKSTGKFAMVIPPYDLHYGKLAWRDETGQSYSRKEARQLLMEHTRNLANQIANFGRPEKIIVPSASDWFHIDTQDGTTTKGTPQDCDGTRAQILMEGCELAFDHLEFMRRIAPVEWLPVPGNHDRDSALTLMVFLKGKYEKSKRVTIRTSPAPRQYVLYGDSLLGYGHGDKLKVANLHGIMTKEARDLWRESVYQYFFTGHLHHKVTQEINGMTHYQLSSLSGLDRFHSKHGYITSGRAMQGFMVSRDRGIIAEFISPVKNNVLFGVKIAK